MLPTCFSAQPAFVFGPMVSALRATACGHALFVFVELWMLRMRWWVGDAYTVCGSHDRREAVEGECWCPKTDPYICWLSECINGAWPKLEPRHAPQIGTQSWLWITLSLLPASTGVWLCWTARRRLDTATGTLSCAFLAIGLLPDTIPWPWKTVHFFVAGGSVMSAFAMQFCLPLPGAALTLPAYIAAYFAISESLVRVDGLDRSAVYEWADSLRMQTRGHGYVPIVMEWALVVGASTCAIVYCVQEDRRRARGPTPTRPSSQGSCSFRDCAAPCRPV